MLFNSLAFCIFFIIVTSFYFLLPHRLRWILLLVASCVFYMFFKPEYILILAFTIIIDYVAGIKIETSQTQKRKKQFLVLSLIANIGILAVFKYYNFINGNITGLLTLFGWSNPIPYLSILLPIGLSFHTFQAMSYTIEVYRGKQKAERHFGIYSLYVMFYPQLVAGPIERPQNLLHQFKEKHIFSSVNLITGLRLMTWGFLKKLVIADRLSIYVDAIYQSPSHYHWLNLVLAAVFFAVQIYFDFSGYSDIAIGAAKSMGFDLMQNFNIPYIAKSVSEFWRRWHISLSTWINDYLYTPLTIATRNYGKSGLIFSLMITFLIMGLWHGASWNFVVFGALHGIILSYETLTKKFRKKISKKIPPSLYNISSSILVFIFWAFSLIFFRTDSMHSAMGVVKNIFSFSQLPPFSFAVVDRNAIEFGFTSAFIALIACLMVFFFERKFKYDLSDLNNDQKKWRDIIFTSLCIILIFSFGIFHKTSFIYFQF